MHISPPLFAAVRRKPPITGPPHLLVWASEFAIMHHTLNLAFDLLFLSQLHIKYYLYFETETYVC
jgi:hypothetical protein